MANNPLTFHFMKKLLITGLCALFSLTAGAAQLELKKGDSVVLIGNTLAERMQHHGWLESYVQEALPKHEITFRNHGFSGDKVNSRPRNRGFINACLLYTSPSPRDRTRSRMPSSA